MRQAIRERKREQAKEGRLRYRLNLPYQAMWQGKRYDVKQVALVVVENVDEIVVITVYTFFF